MTAAGDSRSSAGSRPTLQKAESARAPSRFKPDGGCGGFTGACQLHWHCSSHLPMHQCGIIVTDSQQPRHLSDLCPVLPPSAVSSAACLHCMAEYGPGQLQHPGPSPQSSLICCECPPGVIMQPSAETCSMVPERTIGLPTKSDTLGFATPDLQDKPWSGAAVMRCPGCLMAHLQGWGTVLQLDLAGKSSSGSLTVRLQGWRMARWSGLAGGQRML